MNAQISREWSSLKIILNLLLMILCCCSSLPCCCLAIEENNFQQRATANSSSSPTSTSTSSSSYYQLNNLNLNNNHNLLVHSSGHRLAKLKHSKTEENMMNLLHFYNNNNNHNRNINNQYEKKSRIDALTNMMMMRKRRLNYHRELRRNELRRNYYIEDRKYHRIDRGKLSSKNSYNNHNNHNNNNVSSSTAAAAVAHPSIIHNNNNNNYNNIKIKNTFDGGMTADDEFLPQFLVNNSDNIRYRRESHHSRQPILRFLPVNRNPNRQKRKKYCSARDPKTLAFEAPTVFEGKIKSMTSDRQANFSATLEIVKVYKQQIDFALPRQVRLQFAYRNSSECDIYREEFRHRGFVRDELDQGKIYFLFVKQISLGNFTILGQPMRKFNRTLNEVLKGVNEKYGKQASIDFITPDLSVREGRKVRIVCKVSGEPPPKVTWFKDGKSITRIRSKYDFVYLRRRSDLIIKSAYKSDSGVYECRAKNKLTNKRRPVSQSTKLDVIYYDDRTQETMNGDIVECPPEGKLFCRNGGKCHFIESLREPSCHCPEGFSGKVCEEKLPNITASTYNNPECPQYLGSFYC